MNKYPLPSRYRTAPRFGYLRNYLALAVLAGFFAWWILA
jgi:hypothetical protein